MATITTKYSIGDAVFHASTTIERKKHPCPDCKGALKWTAKSPAGAEYTFACPRCSASFNSDRDLTLDYTAAVPALRCLTIGSVQFNSAPGSWDAGARYMCRETGVGSGTVYTETDLFLTEAEALAATQAKADELNTTTEWIVQLYNKTLKVSDYELHSAAMEAAKDEKHRASQLLWNLTDLFEKIAEADTKDEILEHVDWYKTYDWGRDKSMLESVAA
jgi:hypothetical protein